MEYCSTAEVHQQVHDESSLQPAGTGRLTVAASCNRERKRMTSDSDAILLLEFGLRASQQERVRFDRSNEE